MRHIDFDDSTVLGEFARIASENGWVKQAEEPTETVTFGDEGTEPIVGGSKAYKIDLLKVLEPLLKGTGMLGFFGGPSQKVLARAQILLGAIKQIPDDTPVEQAVNTSGMLLQTMSGEDPEYKEWTNNAFGPWKSLADKYGVKLQMREEALADDASVKEAQANPLTVEMQKLNNIYAQHMKGGNETVAVKAFNQALQKTMQRLRGQYGNHPELVKFEEQAKKILVHADIIYDFSKSAKDDTGKYYDISGETGEQLVEKAHPGGGTKTELTHSKTDENLVETIVEQQKKDVEVARSVPKGTYATLVNLYAKLHKMGHKEHLVGLKSMISSIATSEEVIDYTLVSLADRLDKGGYREAANRVDELLKKKSRLNKTADNYAEKLKSDFINNLQAIEPTSNLHRTTFKPQMLQDAQQITTANLSETARALRMFTRKYSKMFPTMPMLSEPLIAKLWRVMQDQRRSRELARDIKQRQKAPKPEQEPGLAGSTPTVPKVKRSRKTKEFQQWFNKAIKGTDYESGGNALVVDGIYGPKTRHIAKLVYDGYKGRANFEAAMERKRKAKEPSEKDIPLEAIPSESRVYGLEEVYNLLTGMYNHTLRHPKRPTQFPQLGNSPDIRKYLVGAAKEMAGKEYTEKELKKLLFSQIGQMGRAQPEEVAAAGRKML